MVGVVPALGEHVLEPVLVDLFLDRFCEVVPDPVRIEIMQNKHEQLGEEYAFTHLLILPETCPPDVLFVEVLLVVLEFGHEVYFDFPEEVLVHILVLNHSEAVSGWLGHAYLLIS